MHGATIKIIYVYNGTGRSLKIDFANNKYNNLYSFRWKRQRKCFAVLTDMSPKPQWPELP
jgi:hypothetical protein